MADPKQGRTGTVLIELLWAAWGVGTPLLILGAFVAGFSGWGGGPSYLQWAAPLLFGGVACGLLAPVIGHLTALRFERDDAARGFVRALLLTIALFGFAVVKFVA